MIARRIVLLAVAMLALAHPCAAQVTASFIGATPDTADGTTYTLNNVAIGDAASDRDIIVLVLARKTGTANCSITSVTVNGTTAAATTNGTAANNATNCNLASIRRAVRVTTGTTTTVVVTFPATMLRMDLKVFRALSLRSATEFSASNSTAGDPTGTASVLPNGLTIGGAITTANTTVTWTGLTETDDTVVESNITTSSAMLLPSSRDAALSVTADFAAAGGESVGVWASWAPIGPLASSPTHYVTSNGSGSGECTLADPCTVTRAMAIYAGDLMPPGSWVNVACGIYGQAALNPATNAVQNFPVKFVGATTADDCVRFVGTRTSLPASSWSLSNACGGACTYTYEAVFDNVALYDVTNVAQRPPVSTWVDIEVDDRASPFTTGSGRAYSHTEPVRYTPRASVAEVEAQHCTWFHSSAADRLYIHPCRESAPTDADNYYAGSSGWGTIEVDGDDVWFENINFEQTGGGQGLLVDTGANRFTGINIDAMASQLWFRGTNTTLSDIESTNFAEQGANDPNCYSSQYGGANGRSCWNDGANGYQILLGQQNNGSTSGTASNIRVARGWNGVRVDGAWTVDGMSAWGFANHAGQATGTGVTLRNFICANTQDCWYLEGESFNTHLYEHNLFFGGVLVWCSRDGATQGGVTCPTGWTFRRNIFGSMVTDNITEAVVTSDCNVGIPRSPGQSALWRCTQVDGAGCNSSWVDMPAIQAATTHDDNSVGYASTKWTDASLFQTFSNQQTVPASQNALTTNFTLASATPVTIAACGVRAGPTTLTEFASGVPRRFRFRIGP